MSMKNYYFDKQSKILCKCATVVLDLACCNYICRSIWSYNYNISGKCVLHTVKGKGKDKLIPLIRNHKETIREKVSLLHKFLISISDGHQWSHSRSGRCTAGKRAPFTSWRGGCQGPSSSLDVSTSVFTLPRIEPRLFFRAACSLSLFRLSYLSSIEGHFTKFTTPCFAFCGDVYKWHNRKIKKKCYVKETRLNFNSTVSII